MSLVTILIILAITALGLYLFNTYTQAKPEVKRVVNLVVIIVVAIWILIAGIYPHIGHIHIGR